MEFYILKRAKLNHEFLNFTDISLRIKSLYHMKEELDSFVRSFTQYFQNLFNEKSFSGKFNDKIKYIDIHCNASLEKQFFILSYMKELTLNHQNS
ncbi:hypothetical protein BM1374166_00618 [Bartonella tribocorum]|nr:hypothetical protein BM1374166_00618 [Bartonella tribocorum]